MHQKKGFGDKKLDGFLYVLDARDKKDSLAFFASGADVYPITRTGKDWDTFGAKLSVGGVRSTPGPTLGAAQVRGAKLRVADVLD